MLCEERPFAGVRNRLGTAFGIEFAKEITHVLLGRCQGNYQLCGDLSIRCASREQVQNLLFPLSKRLGERGRLR